MKIWQSTLFLSIIFALSGCSISKFHIANADNVMATPEGVFFTLGRVESRSVAVADHESQKILGAKIFLYEITEKEVANKATKPLIQQNAAGWLGGLAYPQPVIIDISKKLLQPLSYEHTGKLLPTLDNISSTGFGRHGYFYAYSGTNLITYVSTDENNRCELKPSLIPLSQAAPLISPDGKVIAVTPGRDDIPYGAPQKKIKVEIFFGCKSKEIVEIDLISNDMIRSVCAYENRIWLTVKHNFNYENYFYSEDVKTNQILKAPEYAPKDQVAFDCYTEEFVWVDVPWGLKSITTALDITLYRYNPKKNRDTKFHVNLLSH